MTHNYLQNLMKFKRSALRSGHEITWVTGAGFLFVFNDCKDAGGRATHGAVAEAYKQAYSELCNCLYNAEDGQKDKSVAQVIKCTFLSLAQCNIVLLLTILPIAAGFGATVDLQQHKPGIWAIEGTKKLNRWIIIHNLAEAKTTGIYHIEVVGRGVKDPVWKIQHLAGHMAISATALAASVIKPLNKGDVYPETFEQAYQAWLKQNQGQGGVVCERSVLACMSQ